MLVGEAIAVGEFEFLHAAVLDDAVAPFLGAVVRGVEFNAGAGFVEREGEIREFFKQGGGDLAVGFEEGELLADEVLVLEPEAEGVFVFHVCVP